MSNYDHTSIKVLKNLEPIQQSPGMFIGETEKATHLITEAFDNAQDEALAGHSSLIAVMIDTKKKEYSVLDNGRGIPFEENTLVKIATELFSGGKFEKGEKNSYGIACLRGDTNIMLLNGEHITIKEMTDNPEKDYWVLTSTLDGKWISEKVVAPRITGYTNKLTRVHIDNGTFVDCTDDHLFLMRDGSYKKAEELCDGDSLMSCHTGSFNNLVEYYNENNHSVVRTEIIKFDYDIPVYDIHTPINHNFVLSNGVVVHNSGLHGVGIVAITALSEYMNINVFRDNKFANVSWENGILEKEIEVQDYLEERPYGTKITFKPCKKYFGSIDVDINYIRKRMKLASVHIPSLKLALIIDNQKEIISCDMKDYFKEEITKDDIKCIHTPTQDLKIKQGKEELIVRWCYCLDGSPTPRHHGSVNILSVDSGTHIEETNRVFRDVLFEISKKKKMNIIKQDCLVSFRALTNIMLFKPEFSSQNKERFSKKKTELSYLYDKLKSGLVDQLTKNEELTYSLLNHFENYRKKLDSTKTIIRTGDTVTRASSTIGGKLRDCTTHSVEQSELFVVEGECFPGDSKIIDVNFNEISFKDLKYKLENGDRVYTFSCSEKGKIVVSKIVRCFITKTSDTLVKVELDNGYVEMCTPEHEWQMQDGSYKRAYDLKIGDILMSIYQKYVQNTSVEVVHLPESIELYDIEVDSEYHNFLLSSGVFVHNSAGGNIVAARDTSIHAILPLKGKSIPNVAGIKDLSQVLKKKGKGRTSTKETRSELVELINACGTGIEPDFRLDGIRYGKIIILPDADADGAHIATMVMAVFLKLMPKLVEAGFLYICQMPLYGVRNQKQFIPFYSEEEMIQYRNNNPKEKILRFKGLGEMNSTQLAECALNEQTRRLTQIKYPEDPDKLFRLMTDSALKRTIV